MSLLISIEQQSFFCFFFYDEVSMIADDLGDVRLEESWKKLSSLFKVCNKMDWSVFTSKVKLHQRGFMGEPNEMRMGRGEFHEYLCSCICQNPEIHPTDLEIAETRRCSK
ncbi:hypothetical protein KSP40_PGU016473 [Platanthera guangdongensis]|uniref:Uncharacterized protein n=1 Tax=Platanthera guangdongensis TaxID=2320717 RepID=A0ABR2LJX6_9ASPA